MLQSRFLAAFLITALPAIAQPPFPGARNITGAHVHFNSSDPDAAMAFWTGIIGTSTYSNESQKGVSTLGITILIDRKAPAGPSAGSAIDHLTLKVPDLQPLVEKLAKTPYKSFHPQADDSRLIIDGPDGVRIELIEDNSMYAALEFDHIELHSAQPKEMQAWYAKNLGGRPGTTDTAISLLIPGAALRFMQADAPLPTAERAIDHICFEVKDIDSFCKKLSENGVKLDSAPRLVPEIKASVAWLTDPWGTRIEVMEKAAR
jgi:catechol 2,3-dioxygenase-like lactoylglutathione lyase family enzyme